MIPIRLPAGLVARPDFRAKIALGSGLLPRWISVCTAECGPQPRAKDAATLAEFPPGIRSRTASDPTLCDRASEHSQALCSIASPDRVPTIRYAWARSGSSRVDSRLAYRLHPRRDHARNEDTRTTHIVQLDEPASGGPGGS